MRPADVRPGLREGRRVMYLGESYPLSWHPNVNGKLPPRRRPLGARGAVLVTGGLGTVRGRATSGYRAGVVYVELDSAPGGTVLVPFSDLVLWPDAAPRRTR